MVVPSVSSLKEMPNGIGDKSMKVIFMGATKFSEVLLRYLLDCGIDVRLILTIPEEFHISYSPEKIRNYNYADLEPIARQHGIPCYEVDSVAGRKIGDYAELIAGLGAEVILSLGWYYMVPRRLRELVRYGAWGIHASLLPRYAGGAPLVWAIIKGEKEAGVTLFRFEDGVDDGDIIAQRPFPIAFEETIQQVYQKAIVCSQEILLEALQHPERVSFQSQEKSCIEVFPQRKPEDGLIDCCRSALDVYNFIRAQARPYPGAFSSINGKKITFWDVRYVDAIPVAEGHMIGELFHYEGEGYLRLSDGCIKILEARLGDRDGDFSEIAAAEGLWGGRLGS